MDDLSDFDSETSEGETAATVDRKPSLSRGGEDAFPEGQRKSAFPEGQRRAETPKADEGANQGDDRRVKTMRRSASTPYLGGDKREPSFYSQDVDCVEESDFLRMVEMNTFIRNENKNLRQQRDAIIRGLDKPKRSYRKVIILSIGAVCGLLVIMAVFWALLVGLTGGCNTSEEAFCTQNNATCSKTWYKPQCKCKIVGQEFHMSTCQYRCHYDPRGFCPNGICYRARCFRDVFAFVTFIHDERCKATDSQKADPICTVSCAEIVKHVCADNSSSPLFCDDSKPTILKDFSCQRGNVSKGFVALPSDKEKECLRSDHCKSIMALYPCLAGYVDHGSVFCSKKCVVPKNSDGEPLFLSGHCFVKTANCGASMTKLMQLLSGSEIGYPYTTDDFSKYLSWVASNINRSPNLSRLLYPLMLAYGVLGDEDKVSIKSDAPQRVSWFAGVLKKDDVQQLLTSLYKADLNIVRELLEIVEQKAANSYIYQDRKLRAAYLVINGDCKTFNECPNITGSLGSQNVVIWAEGGTPYCSLSKALFSMNLAVNATWCESIGSLQAAVQLSTKSVSFIYSPSFVSNLISQTKYINDAMKLDDAVFKRSRALCDIEEKHQTSSNETMIPMALSHVLGWVNNEGTKPKRISGFAIVLANAVSVKKAICNEEDRVPSVDCELRLYLAFLSFLPEPSKEEKALVANGDKAMVYFTVRAAMRRQLSRGSENPHINKNQTFPVNSKHIAEAAAQLVNQCLGRIPN